MDRKSEPSKSADPDTPGRPGERRPAPAWLLVLLLLSSGIVTPLFLVGRDEDAALSGTVTGRMLPGGTDVSSDGGPVCKDAPVEFEVDGQQYAGTTRVDTACPSAGDVDEVTIRYDPGNPDDFTNLPRQSVVLLLLAIATGIGFLVIIVAIVRRIWDVVARRSMRSRQPAD